MGAAASAQKNFDQFVGSDGKLDLQEFGLMFKNAGQGGAVSQEQIVKLFEAFDRSGDGEVDRKEFHKAMPALGLDVPKAEIDALFDEWDPDHSGQISFEELSKQHGGDLEKVIELRDPCKAKAQKDLDAETKAISALPTDAVLDALAATFGRPVGHIEEALFGDDAVQPGESFEELGIEVTVTPCCCLSPSPSPHTDSSSSDSLPLLCSCVAGRGEARRALQGGQGDGGGSGGRDD